MARLNSKKREGKGKSMRRKTKESGERDYVGGGTKIDRLPELEGNLSWSGNETTLYTLFIQHTLPRRFSRLIEELLTVKRNSFKGSPKTNKVAEVGGP